VNGTIARLPLFWDSIPHLTLFFNFASLPLFFKTEAYVCPFFEFRQLNKNGGPKKKIGKRKDWQKKEKENTLPLILNNSLPSLCFPRATARVVPLLGPATSWSSGD
jgi:hypothetical protein